MRAQAYRIRGFDSPLIGKLIGRSGSAIVTAMLALVEAVIGAFFGGL